MKRRNRAFTLMEAMVAMFLFSLMAIIITFLFSRGMTITQNENAYIELEQTASFVMQNLESDLLASGVSGLSYGPPSKSDYSALAVNRIADVGTEGQLLWQGGLVVYLHHQSEDTLKRVLPDAGAAPKNVPQLLDASGFDSVIDDNLEAEMRASGVTSFQVENQGPNNSGRLVEVELLLERKGSANHTRSYELKRTIALRN